ncbi:MAG: RNA 2',3'-cyclic phosphodiesterase [Xanthomonadales bacterium]|nr:RNA 2',3'-cyclic phosphodiesterase [Xanthomonadales bacterium]
MSRQTSLPGFQPSVATDRLFLAIFPDPGMAAALATLAAAQCAAHGLRGRPVQPGRLHVTLFHLGDTVGLRQEVVDAVSVAASRVEMAAFELAFDQVGSFNGRRDKLPFVLRAHGGNAPLHALHAALATELREVGLGRFAAAPFEPHVTLAYDTRTVVMQDVAPLAWQAREFVLVHSLLGQTRHVPLGRWRLA